MLLVDGVEEDVCRPGRFTHSHSLIPAPSAWSAPSPRPPGPSPPVWTRKVSVPFSRPRVTPFTMPMFTKLAHKTSTAAKSSGQSAAKTAAAAAAAKGSVTGAAGKHFLDNTRWQVRLAYLGLVSLF